MKINYTKSAKSRLVIVTLIFITVMTASLFSFGLPAGASAGLMLGLKEPLSSTLFITILALSGLYISPRRTLEITILSASLLLAFSFSVSINLVATHPALFRTIIFMCVSTMIFVISETASLRKAIYSFAAAGYFLGMGHGINLPEIICPLYYLIGLCISVVLLFAGFTLLGIAIGSDAISLIQKNVSEIFREKLLIHLKKFF